MGFDKLFPAEHDVGLFVAVQVIVADLPVDMDIGLTDSDTTGTAGIVTVRGTLF